MINAMIFAAGLGTRLHPYTANCPKALVKIGQFTLLEIALKKMERLQVKRVVVNVHHHAGQIIDFIKRHQTRSFEIVVSDETDQLLDTGGGLRKAASLFTEKLPILIYNADVLTSANLNQLLQMHENEKNMATLMVQDRNASRFLLFDGNNELCGWQNPKTGEEKWVTHEQDNIIKLGFNGIQIVDYTILDLIQQTGAFPIIPEYLRIAAKHRIAAWQNWQGSWFDIGTPDKLKTAENYFLSCTPDERDNFF